MYIFISSDILNILNIQHVDSLSPLTLKKQNLTEDIQLK